VKKFPDSDRKLNQELLVVWSKEFTFHNVMPEPPSNEFRIEGSGSESPDAALHESLLANENAEANADIAAVQAAMSLGVPIESAVSMFAGDLARSRLIAEGLLNE
jgi:hypothetical protein